MINDGATAATALVNFEINALIWYWAEEIEVKPRAC